MDPRTAAAITTALTHGPALRDLDRDGAEDIAGALADLPEPDAWAAVKSADHSSAVLAVGSVEFVLDAGVTATGELELSRRVRTRQG
jgi:hypothetical protein